MQAEVRNNNFEERKMYVGLDEFSVVAVNPTRKELNKLFDKEDSDKDEEIDYIDEKDGLDRIKIKIYLKGLSSGKITPVTFFLVDKDKLSNDGLKKQYINQLCASSWTDNPDNLENFFTAFENGDKISYRVAKEGEADFYAFIKEILCKINYKSPNTSIEFSFKKFMRGDFSELKTWLMDENYAGPVTSLLYVKTVGEGEDQKTYNEIFYKGTMKARMLNRIQTAIYDYYNSRLEEIKASEELFEQYKIKGLREALVVNDIYGYIDTPVNLKFKDKFDQMAWDKLIKNTTGQYGCKGFYKLTPIFDYDKSMDITARKENLDNSDSSY